MERTIENIIRRLILKKYSSLIDIKVHVLDDSWLSGTSKHYKCYFKCTKPLDLLTEGWVITSEVKLLFRMMMPSDFDPFSSPCITCHFNCEK